MSKFPYIHQSQLDEHDYPQVPTKKVSMYGWDHTNLEKKRLSTDNNGNLVVSDFWAISKGRVPGESPVRITAANTRVGTEFEDVWCAGAFTELNYDGQTANFTPGLVLTGTNSGATGIIVTDIDNGATGTLLLKELEGVFQNDEPITDTGGGAAVADGTTSDILEMEYPTAGETWEILSSSANDTSDGTGARTVTIQYLDTNYVNRTEVKTLNGITPVAFDATDAFRPQAFNAGIRVLTSGTGKKNEGDIIVRDSSTKKIRACILAGENIALSSHYTVQAGVTAYVVNPIANINKNEDIEMQFKTTLGNNGIFYLGLPLSVYQSSFALPLVLKVPIPEKSDTKLVSKSNNTTAQAVGYLQYVEVTNG